MENLTSYEKMLIAELINENWSRFIGLVGNEDDAEKIIKKLEEQ